MEELRWINKRQGMREREGELVMVDEGALEKAWEESPP